MLAFARSGAEKSAARALARKAVSRANVVVGFARESRLPSVRYAIRLSLPLLSPSLLFFT